MRALRETRCACIPSCVFIATRDIYETAFDEDIQTDTESNQCPECNGRVTTNTVETVCEDCGLVIEEQRLDHGPKWRGFDEDDRDRTGVPLTAARHDRGPWYNWPLDDLDLCESRRETWGERSLVEAWFGLLKYRTRLFYNRFPHYSS
jgi:hypothetical protein